MGGLAGPADDVGFISLLRKMRAKPSPTPARSEEIDALLVGEKMTGKVAFVSIDRFDAQQRVVVRISPYPVFTDRRRRFALSVAAGNE
jgi:hypothetical protein